MEDCIFCKLANGVFPTKSIYEDEEFKVILDLSPATKGHVLIIPKEHASDIYDLPENIVHNIFPLAQKMVKKITNKLKCDELNIV